MKGCDRRVLPIRTRVIYLHIYGGTLRAFKHERLTVCPRMLHQSLSDRFLSNKPRGLAPAKTERHDDDARRPRGHHCRLWLMVVLCRFISERYVFIARSYFIDNASRTYCDNNNHYYKAGELMKKSTRFRTSPIIF